MYIYIYIYIYIYMIKKNDCNGYIQTINGYSYNQTFTNKSNSAINNP